MMNSDNQIIAEIPKNSTEKIVISKADYHGQSYADIRVWWQPDNAPEHLATKKGVAVRLDRLPELVSALQVLEADVEYLNNMRGAA